MQIASDRITMTRPDDFHVHLRDGRRLRDVVEYHARRYGQCLIMPNLKPPVTSVVMAADYRKDIVRALELQGRGAFLPLMTLYLTDNTTVEEIRRAKESGFVVAAKYYPAGATTNSDNGVTDIRKIYRVLEEMQKCGLVLCIHGEVTDSDVMIFDREKVFIDRHLTQLAKQFPGLKMVFEHITTGAGVDFVLDAGPNVAATITPHHLLCNMNSLLVGGIKPHLYCLPILKSEDDRRDLIDAATSGNPKFFLGTDSAPHPRYGPSGEAKETACGCAGAFIPYGIELYAEVFDAARCLHLLEGFSSHFGADFYGLPRNRDTITLVRQEWKVEEELSFGDHVVVPFRAGGTMHWRVL